MAALRIAGRKAANSICIKRVGEPSLALHGASTGESLLAPLGLYRGYPPPFPSGGRWAALMARGVGAPSPRPARIVGAAGDKIADRLFLGTGGKIVGPLLLGAGSKIGGGPCSLATGHKIGGGPCSSLLRSAPTGLLSVRPAAATIKGFRGYSNKSTPDDQSKFSRLLSIEQEVDMLNTQICELKALSSSNHAKTVKMLKMLEDVLSNLDKTAAMLPDAIRHANRMRKIETRMYLGSAFISVCLAGYIMAAAAQEVKLIERERALHREAMELIERAEMEMDEADMKGDKSE